MSLDRDAFDINSGNPFPGNSAAISSLSKLRKGGRKGEKSLVFNGKRLASTAILSLRFSILILV